MAKETKERIKAMTDAKDIKRVLVVGSGVMGNSIAQVFALADISVALVDVDEKVLSHAINLIKSGLTTLADCGKIPSDRIPSILSRIQLSTNLTEVAGDADFIIEAVNEDPDVKKKVFSQLDEICPANTVIASNTSGLNIFSIAEIKRPDRLVIAHFFAPANIIPLVEIVPGSKTSPEVVSFTKKLLERVGKSPIVLKEFVPSFIVNRIQNAMGLAVMEMLEKGWASPEDIDRAIKFSLGIRLPIIGVVQSMDFNGLDLVRNILKSIGKDSSFFDRKVEQGHLGVKSGRGIYDYRGRIEAEILRKRDKLFLLMIDYLTIIDAFDPI
jgi:3-hydroxybutyryl-CoA dehydrogenase